MTLGLIFNDVKFQHGRYLIVMKINSTNSRRDLLKASAAAVVTASLARESKGEQAETQPTKPTLCLFSKPLQNRPVQDLPPILTEFKFSAVDLTCRSGGHVLPARVIDDLPKAHELFNAAG